MTAAVLPVPGRPMPVQHGLAEQLARIAYFAVLELPEAGELNEVAAFLIGDVGEALDRAMLWDQLQEPAIQLWHLVTDDWDEGDLDEIPEADWQRFDFATQQQEIDHRYTLTRERLADEIEHAIRRSRYAAMFARRSEQRRAHAVAVEASIHQHPAGKRLHAAESPDGVA